METAPSQAESVQFPEIAADINFLTDVDQDLREENLQKMDSWDENVDKNSLARMKEIVAQIDWPTTSKVGQKASHNAWLLVQHADRDPAFQQQCLDLMKQEPIEEVARKDIAMLEDRIRVNTHRPQLYGTQFHEVGGKLVPRPIEDPDQVDERRAQAGLGTLQEGIEGMYETYGPPK